MRKIEIVLTTKIHIITTILLSGMILDPIPRNDVQDGRGPLQHLPLSVPAGSEFRGR
jgi:hypothetical protein